MSEKKQQKQIFYCIIQNYHVLCVLPLSIQILFLYTTIVLPLFGDAILFHKTSLYLPVTVRCRTEIKRCAPHYSCGIGVARSDMVRNCLSHLWDRPVSIFRDLRFSRQTNHVRFTGKCMLYSLCQLPQFSMLSLFKINNSLYISFQSFINTQILTISILLHNNLHAIHKSTELLFWLTWRGNNSHCLHDCLLKVHKQTRN